MTRGQRQYRRDPEKSKAAHRRWVSKNREHLRAYWRRHRYAKQLRDKYGMTVEDYEKRSKKQRGVCAICLGLPTGRWTRLAVDHDHRTGRVRGLLCNRCNRVLGQLGDSPGLFRRAAVYLSRGVK